MGFTIATVVPGKLLFGGGGFMIGKSKCLIPDDKLKQAEDLMKKFNDNAGMSDEEDPSSYLKIGSNKFNNSGNVN